MLVRDAEERLLSGIKSYLIPLTQKSSYGGFFNRFETSEKLFSIPSINSYLEIFIKDYEIKKIGKSLIGIRLIYPEGTFNEDLNVFRDRFKKAGLEQVTHFKKD